VRLRIKTVAANSSTNFLQDWKGKLVCDDFGGYKASFELGVTEIGCMAHGRTVVHPHWPG